MEPFGYSGDSPYAWNGSGGRWDEWLEFIFGSAPEDEETMTLTAELSYATRTVRDTWEFRIPVSMIRGGGDPEVSGSAVLPVVDEADSMFLSLMYEENPDNLTPVGISHEKDGIRMTVHSVLAEGQEALVARWESVMKNARLLIGLLQEQYGYTGEEPEIVHLKYKCRGMLAPLVHIPEYYQRWKETFPEVDRKVLFSRSCSLEEKFWFALIHLRLYHPVKQVTGWFRNHRRSDS